jgi:hypothetical protein
LQSIYDTIDRLKKPLSFLFLNSHERTVVNDMSTDLEKEREETEKKGIVNLFCVILTFYFLDN